MAPTLIRAVIFDIGGVLVRTVDWSWRRKWEQQLGLSEGELSSLVFDCEGARLASIGAGPDSAIWEYAAKKLGLNQWQIRQLHSDFWAGDELNASFLAYIRSLRPRWKTAILSNAWPEMRDINVQHFGLIDVVDVIDYSFQTGILKPEPGAFQIVLGHLGVRAEESVMVDDYMQNILGARSFGMQAVHFRDTPQAVQELKTLLG